MLYVWQFFAMCGKIARMIMSTNQFCRQSIASKKTRKAEEKTKGYMFSYVWQNVAMCGKIARMFNKTIWRGLFLQTNSVDRA